VTLINATRVALKKEMLVVTCVPWSPAGIDGRYYPYKALADASDLLYVMDYDTQSQELNSACLASANAPFYGMVHGITE
jgi:di-N-acetylchitobiase